MHRSPSDVKGFTLGILSEIQNKNQERNGHMLEHVCIFVSSEIRQENDCLKSVCICVRTYILLKLYPPIRCVQFSRSGALYERNIAQVMHASMNS